MSSRIPCCVPFCRRTVADTGRFNEWICGDHWRLVPRIDRAIYARAKRKTRKAGTWTAAAARIWRRVKRIAIERAAGV